MERKSTVSINGKEVVKLLLLRVSDFKLVTETFFPFQVGMFSFSTLAISLFYS